jgi:hypothetical protein
VCTGLGGTQLYADAGFYLGHNRKENHNHINALVQEGCIKFFRHRGFLEYNGYNGVVGGFDFEISCCHLLVEIAGIGFQLVARRLQTLNTVYNDTLFRATEGEIDYTGVSFLEKLVNRLTIGVQIYPHEKLELMAGYHFQRRRELNVFNQINGLNGLTFGTALKLRKMHFMYATGFYQRNLFHQLTVNINWRGVL